MKAKILVIGPLPPPVHGVANVMRDIVQSDLPFYFEMEVLDIADRGPNAAKTIGTFTISNSVQALLNISRFYWRCFRHKPDVVFLFLSQSRWGFLRDSFFIRIARLFDAKVIANLGGAYFREFYDGQKAGRKRRMRRVLDRISLIQVLGFRLKSIFKDLVPEERITVTPNGIDMKPYKEAIKRRGDKRPAKNILYLSSMIVGKGVVDLIDAFNIVAEEHGEAVLHLVGPWTRRKDPELIKSAIGRSRFKDRIHYHGTLVGDEKMGIFMSADLFAFPTYYRNEGQPVVLLEAMASGLPIITCERGTTSEMVIDGKGGFVVPPRSPERIAAAIETIFSSPELAAKMGEFNIEHVNAHYSMDIFVRKNRVDIESLL